MLSHVSKDVRNEWYAAALSKDVIYPGPRHSQRIKPTSVSILGTPLVLWRDASGRVSCVEDKCPHRSVPLSLGYNEGGRLECLYHGWQIETQTEKDLGIGKVVKIPSISLESKIPASAKCKTFETFEQNGVIYIWLGSHIGQEGKESGDLQDLKEERMPAPDQMDDGKGFLENGYVCQLLCYDLPIGHDLMIENLLDPAHIPFAHEGTIGRRKDAQPLEMQINKTKRGIRGHVKAEYFNQFEAPCTIILHTPISAKMDMWQFVSCTPVSPERMRIVYRAYRNWATWIERVPFLASYFNSFSNKIIFQDYQLLAGQQQRLKEGARAWNVSVQVDSLPLAYRRWWKGTFGDTSSTGPWWRGWDVTKSQDIEDLCKQNIWGFDCDGCSTPMLPAHPLNPLPEIIYRSPQRAPAGRGARSSNLITYGLLAAAAVGILALYIL